MNGPKVSYSQSGEDLIIDFIFDTLQVKAHSYLDIGAHHAKHLSNSYYFYEKGVSGVCIEPDPVLCEAIKKIRPRDICLSVGVGGGGGKAKLYIMDPPTLNTFSEKEAKIYQEYYPWTKITGEISVKLMDINKIFRKYFKGGLDILSVDTEGMDMEIIKALDLKKYRPCVICAETVVYDSSDSLLKNRVLIDYLVSHNYFVYADTFINTVFVDTVFWDKNKGAKLEGFNA